MKQWHATGFASALLGVLLSALAGCESPNTFAPDLEMTMGIPLLAEEVQVGERILKADSVRVVPEDSSRMEIFFAQEDVQVRNDGYIGQDRLDIAPQDRQTSSYEVGLIEIGDVPPENSEPIYFEDVVPGLGSIPPGQTAIPFGGTDVPVSSEELAFDNFQSATFSDESTTGLNRLRLSVANRSPFMLQDVVVYISSTGATNPDGSPVQDDLLIDPVTFTSVAAGDSATSAPVALANLTIPGTIHMMYEMSIAAGTIPTAEIPGSYVRLTTDITALEVIEATAQLPQQDFERTREIEFTSAELDLHLVTLADLGLDYVNIYDFTLSNTLPVNVSIHYQLPNFLHIPKAPTGDVASLIPDNTDNYSRGTIFAAPNQTLNIKFLLDQARFESTTGFALDEISITFNVNIEGSGDQFVQIEQDNGIELISEISQLSIKRVEGAVPPAKPIEVEIEPFELSVDESGLPAGLSGLHATDMAVGMDIQTEGFTSTMYTDLKMRVFDYETMTQSAFYERELSVEIELGTEMRYRVTKDSLGAQSNSPIDIINATLDNMFDAGQSTINLEGFVRVTGVVTLIRDESRIQIPRMSIRAPMRFELPAAITFDAKSETDEAFNPGLSDEVRNDFIPRTQRATIFAEIENHFPSAGTLVMYASPDPYFTKLRQQYPADNQDDVSTIPDRIPATAQFSNEAASVAEGAVFELFTVELPEPTLLADGSVDPENPGITTDPVEVQLDDELALFGYDNIYLLPRIQLRYDSSPVIHLRPDDHLKLSLMMFLTAQTNEVEDTP